MQFFRREFIPLYTFTLSCTNVFHSMFKILVGHVCHLCQLILVSDMN